MIRKIIILLLSIVALNVEAEKADVAVSYEYSYPYWLGKPKTDKMMLLASDKESKYFNEISLFNDSLVSTPGGEKKLREIILASCMVQKPDGSVMIDLSRGPSKSIYTYVFINRENNRLRYYDRWSEDEGYYEESLDDVEWKIVSDSTKSVLGYECVMAETDYHGRRWKAWFSPDIPLPYGPWKLQGLPGLILEAEAQGGFCFKATGIEESDREITPMYSSARIPRVERIKVLSEDEYFKNNTSSVLKAKYGGSVKVEYQDDEGNKLESPEYDGFRYSIETDYKKTKR